MCKRKRGPEHTHTCAHACMHSCTQSIQTHGSKRMVLYSSFLLTALLVPRAPFLQLSAWGSLQKAWTLCPLSCIPSHSGGNVVALRSRTPWSETLVWSCQLFTWRSLCSQFGKRQERLVQQTRTEPSWGSLTCHSGGFLLLEMKLILPNALTLRPCRMRGLIWINTFESSFREFNSVNSTFLFT